MLDVKGDLEISQGTDIVKLKTNDLDQLVLSFSSWKVFGGFMRLPKTANSDFFKLRKNLKHLTTEVKVEIEENHSFLLVKGKPQSLSISTLIKIMRYSLIR